MSFRWLAAEHCPLSETALENSQLSMAIWDCIVDMEEALEAFGDELCCLRSEMHGML